MAESTVRTIGPSGQVSLDKRYAGKRALVDEVEPGIWVIKIGQPATGQATPMDDLLTKTFGIWKHGDGLQYQNELRDEWDHHE